MKKFLSVLLAAIMVFSLSTVAFGIEEVAEDTTVAAAAEATTAMSEATQDSFMGSLLAAEDADGIKTAIKDAFAKAKENIENLSLDDILALPTNIMDDIVTNFFAILQALGVDVDALYEKLASSKILNWIANFYKGGCLTKTTEKVQDVPATGSSAAIAVFATLSLAAAAAFVSYKKKEA